MPEGVDATGRRRTLSALGIISFGLFAAYGGLLGILLPQHVAAIDEAAKVVNLALVTSVSFAVTTVAPPLVGALSDGTRARLGRRTPWVIAGVVVGAAFLLGLGGVHQILWVCVFWTIIQFSLNGADIASGALLVDRFPAGRRGVASTVLAGAALVGGGAGTLLAGRLAVDLPLAYTTLAIVVVVCAAVFAVLVREGPSYGIRRPRTTPAAVIAAFRHHPAFGWAFASRFFFIVGYQGVHGYLLYLLTDYVGIPTGEAVSLVGLLTVAGLVALVVAVLLGGWLSDRVGRRKPFVIAACVVLALSLLVPLTSPTLGGMVVYAICHGFGFGLYLVCGIVLVSEVLPGGEQSAARDLGVYNVATNLGQAIGPAMAAAVLGIAGYPALFVIALAGVLLAGALILPVRGVR